MTNDELERRLEIRMENCEDALSKWPDSPAWLARYHELGKIRGLAQQLDSKPRLEAPDLADIAHWPAKEPVVLPKGGTLYGVLLYSHAKAKEWKRPMLTGRQLENICANFHVLKNNEGFIPKVSKYGEVQALRICTLDDSHGLEADLKLYAPFAVEIVGIELHLDTLPYRTKDGGSLEPVLHGVQAQGHLQESGLGALVQRWAMLIEAVDMDGKPVKSVQNAQEAPVTPEPQALPKDQGDPEKAQHAPKLPAQQPKMDKTLRQKVLKIIKMEGTVAYETIRGLTGQNSEAVDPVLKTLCDGQKIEQYKHGWYRSALKRQGLGRKKRPEYIGTPDGSTDKSWATRIRKAALYVLKESWPASRKVGEIKRLIDNMPEFETGKVPLEDLETQLENLHKRGVVGSSETDGGRDRSWLAAKR